MTTILVRRSSIPPPQLFGTSELFLCWLLESNEGRRTISLLRGRLVPKHGAIPEPDSRQAGQAHIQARLLFIWVAPTHADLKISSMKRLLLDWEGSLGSSATFKFRQAKNEKGSWLRKIKRKFTGSISTLKCASCRPYKGTFDCICQQEALCFSSLPKLGIIFWQHWSKLICKLQRKSL